MARTPHRLKTAARLTPLDWLDLSRAIVALMLARIALSRYRPMAARNADTPTNGGGASAQARAVRARVALAVRRGGMLVPWRSDCLVSALAAQRLLRWLGQDSRIVLGARPTNAGALDAHAWVEVDGMRLFADDDRPHRPFVPVGER